MKLEMGKLQDKHKLAIFFIIIVCSISLFYYILLLPQVAKMNTLTTQAQLNKQRIKIIERFALEHPDIDYYNAELDKKISSVNTMLPNEVEFSNFLSQLDGAAKTAHVSLVQVKPGQMVNKEGYTEIPVEILVRGTYHQTLHFLTSLESLSRFNTVTSITTQSRQAILESKVVVVIYSYGVVQK